MNEKKKDYDIVALIYPDRAYAAEMLGASAGEKEIYEQICQVVDEVNSTVQTYKRISLTILRQEEFVKNSSRKIKRVGLADSVKDEYLAKRG
jgi:hypothetical protein